MATSIEKEIDKLIDTKTSENVKYKIPKCQQLLRLGYKPITFSQMRERFGCDAIEKNYPQMLMNEYLKKTYGDQKCEPYKECKLYKYLQKITQHIHLGEERKFIYIAIPYTEELKIHVKTESINEYMGDIIPDRVHEDIAKAKKYGFRNFMVAYPEAEKQKIQIPDPIVFSQYPLTKKEYIQMYVYNPLYSIYRILSAPFHGIITGNMVEKRPKKERKLAEISCWE